MRVEIGPEFTCRLHQDAKQQGLSVEQLGERILGNLDKAPAEKIKCRRQLI